MKCIINDAKGSAVFSVYSLIVGVNWYIPPATKTEGWSEAYNYCYGNFSDNS